MARRKKLRYRHKQAVSAAKNLSILFKSPFFNLHVTWLAMNDVTRILQVIDQGDPRAAERLLPLVYEELRKLAAARMAQESLSHTLQATALVHEAYLRLVSAEAAQHWNSRGHFFAAAAEAMRRILINLARDKRRLKRGGHWRRVDLEQIELADEASPDDLLSLDASLFRLENESPECAQLVKLRFFAGLSISQAADAMGISPSTAKRHWAYARAWLYDALRPDASSASA